VKSWQLKVILARLPTLRARQKKIIISGREVEVKKSEAKDTYSEDYAVKFAHDGNINTLYAPDHPPNNWVTFNLGALHAIVKIVIINRIDNSCCVKFLDHTNVNVVRTATKKITICGMIRVTSTVQTKEQQTYSFNCNGVVGDEVKLTRADTKQDSEEGPSLAEIQIFGFGGNVLTFNLEVSRVNIWR
jgi:hypothetical protein